MTTPSIWASYAHRLRERREAAGLSQAALAERAGLTRAAVSHFEAGTHSPRLDTLAALLHGLGVTLGEFFSG